MIEIKKKIDEIVYVRVILKSFTVDKPIIEVAKGSQIQTEKCYKKYDI